MIEVVQEPSRRKVAFDWDEVTHIVEEGGQIFIKGPSTIEVAGTLDEWVTRWRKATGK